MSKFLVLVKRRQQCPPSHSFVRFVDLFIKKSYKWNLSQGKKMKLNVKKNVFFLKNKITWSIFMTKNEKGRESLLVYILTLTCSSATPLLCPLLRPIDSLAPFCVLAARSSSRASLSYPSVSLTSLLVFLRG